MEVRVQRPTICSRAGTPTGSSAVSISRSILWCRNPGSTAGSDADATFNTPARNSITIGARNEFWHVVGAADFRAGSRAEAAMGLLDEFAAAWISAALPPWFYAAASEVRLVAAVKPGSPPEAPDARPIATSGTLRRTIERTSMVSVRSGLADHFWPLNVGCAVPGGISVLLTLGFNLLAHHRPDLAFLKIDLRNAHNCVLRQAMVQAAYDAGGRIRALVPLL